MAYGASLESWLGESPRGFESPILRGMRKPPLRGFFHSRILVELYSNPGSWFRGRLRRIASRRGPPFSAIAKGASFIGAPFAML